MGRSGSGLHGAKGLVDSGHMPVPLTLERTCLRSMYVLLAPQRPRRTSFLRSPVPPCCGCVP